MSSIKNTHLYQEIHEQPAVIERLLQTETQAIERLAQAIRERGITHVIIAARGTSDNAGRYAQYVLGSFNRLPVGLTTPSLFSVYQSPPDLKNALVLGISQSGKSPDVVAVVAEGRRQGALTAVITNKPDSDMAREGEFVINLQAGEERAVAATKTYTSELAAVACLSAALSGSRAQLVGLDRVPAAMRGALSLNERVARETLRYRYMQRCVVIGRGYNYATAFELALKIKELTYTNAEAYSSADFLHGPLAIVDRGFPVIVIAPRGRMSPELLAFMGVVHERGAELLAISDEEAVLGRSDLAFKLPVSVDEWLSPLTAIVPGQLLALHLAAMRGHDVDAPRAIQKVTETH